MGSQRVAVKLVGDAALVDFEHVSDPHLRPDLRPERRCHLFRRSEDRAFAGGQNSLELSHSAFPISSVSWPDNSGKLSGPVPPSVYTIFSSHSAAFGVLPRTDTPIILPAAIPL